MKLTNELIKEIKLTGKALTTLNPNPTKQELIVIIKQLTIVKDGLVGKVVQDA